jgi:hypothetical protein
MQKKDGRIAIAKIPEAKFNGRTGPWTNRTEFTKRLLFNLKESACRSTVAESHSLRIREHLKQRTLIHRLTLLPEIGAQTWL